jgi:hypothetical protein
VKLAQRALAASLGVGNGGVLMDPAQARAYEQACVALLRDGWETDSYMREIGRSLREVRIDGEFPDTKLKVVYFDDPPGAEDCFEIALWKTNIFSHGDDRASPRRVASLVHVSLMERPRATSR